MSREVTVNSNFDLAKPGRPLFRRARDDDTKHAAGKAIHTAQAENAVLP
jgi:hypothetical protein